MTEIEALEKVNELHSKIVRSPFAKNVTESEMLAFIECKKALEKQEKIKEAFTHYTFSGNEMNILNDCVKCLAEIKDILNGSDEE